MSPEKSEATILLVELRRLVEECQYGPIDDDERARAFQAVGEFVWREDLERKMRAALLGAR